MGDEVIRAFLGEERRGMYVYSSILEYVGDAPVRVRHRPGRERTPTTRDACDPAHPFLRSAKPKPAPLLRLRRRALDRLCGSCGLWLGRALLAHLARVVDVVPGDVEEDGLHGDEGHLGREVDDVVEVDAADGELVEALDEGRQGGGGGLLLLVLAQVVDVDDGAVALELAVEEPAEEFDGGGGNLDVEGLRVRGVGGLGEAGRLLADARGVVDQAESVGDFADNGMRTANGEAPGTG